MALAFCVPVLGQEEPGEAKVTHQESTEKKAIEELRARFSSPEADAATLAITAAGLIEKGDRDWLRRQLSGDGLSEAGVLAVITAFKEQGDLLALPEILNHSMFDEREKIKTSAARAIQSFLNQNSTRSNTVKQLLEITGSESSDQVLAALNALGGAGEFSAVETIISFLDHGNEAVRAQAVASLTKLTHQHFGTDQEAWRSWWEENKHLPRHLIIEPALIRQITDLERENESLRAQRNQLAVEFINCNPQKAVDFLTWDEPGIQQRAAEILFQNVNQEWISGISDRIIAYLRSGSPDEAVLEPLLKLMGSHAEKKPEAQAILLEYLDKDPRDAIKVVAARSLKGFKNETVRKAGHDLLQRLEQEKSRNQLKEQLLDLLAAVGSGPSLNLLEHYLSSENGSSKGVRQKAARALGRSGRPEAIEVLGKAMKKEPDRDVRSDIATSLTELGTADDGMKARAVEQLEQNLIDREAKVRSACVVGIGKLVPPNALAIFKEHLLKTESDPEVLRWYIQALGWIKDPAGLEMISKVLPAGNNDAYPSFLQWAGGAVKEICGEDLPRWKQSIEVFYGAGHYTLAIQCCDDYLSRSKGKNGNQETLKQVKIRRHESYVKDSLARGDLAKALESAKLLTELDPENRAFFLERARILEAMKNWPDAKAAYEQLLSRIPSDQTEELWQAKLALARCLIEMGMTDAGLKMLQGAPEGLSEAVATGIAELRARVGEVKPKAPESRTEPEPAPVKEPPPGSPDPEKGKGETKAEVP
jgi:HEAT repeat protein